MQINNDFEIEEVVFLKVRQDKICGMVISIIIEGNDTLKYEISWEDGMQSIHNEFELTDKFKESKNYED